MTPIINDPSEKCADSKAHARGQAAGPASAMVSGKTCSELNSVTSIYAHRAWQQEWRW
jgi:hypothetical protein